MAVANNIRGGHLLAQDALPPAWLIVLYIAGAVASSAAAITGPIVGTTLGWIATKRIRTSDGAEYGLPYSVIAALLYPAIMIWIVTLMNSEWGMVTLYRRDGLRIVNDEYWTIMHGIWIIAASGLSLVLVATLAQVQLRQAAHCAIDSIPAADRRGCSISQRRWAGGRTPSLSRRTFGRPSAMSGSSFILSPFILRGIFCRAAFPVIPFP